jgi:hypothetical protein
MMKRRDFLLAGSGSLLAQEQAPDQTIFGVAVTEVVVPVVVQDKDGFYVSGLEVKDFRLFDNEKPQAIKLDVSFVPISLVVCVQANGDVEPVLGSIKKIGPLLEGLVIGSQGEAAIVAFDHRIRGCSPRRSSRSTREVPPARWWTPISRVCGCCAGDRRTTSVSC